jgi:hypothetical protein
MTAVIERSWRVQVEDESGTVWSNGVRLAGRDEAMCYMGNALYDFRDREFSIVQMRAIECNESVNIRVERCQRGPRKGRARPGNAIIFDHGTCDLFKWYEDAAIAVAA